MTHPARRRFLQQGAVLVGAGVALSTGHAALAPTPRAASGPFYPEQYPLDSDADLVTVSGQDRPASGEVTHLLGKVVDSAGNPLADLQVEIWQCDAFGFYHHSRDRGGQAEAQFQGFGRTTTGAGGEYRFRTIKPMPYTGRTPHIHFLVRSADTVYLVSQLYDRDEPMNQRDGLFRRIPEERRKSVTTVFRDVDGTDHGFSESASLVAEFDIVLGVTPTA